MHPTAQTSSTLIASHPLETHVKRRLMTGESKVLTLLSGLLAIAEALTLVNAGSLSSTCLLRTSHLRMLSASHLQRQLSVRTDPA